MTRSVKIKQGETHVIPLNLYLNVRSGFTGRLQGNRKFPRATNIVTRCY